MDSFPGLDNLLYTEQYDLHQYKSSRGRMDFIKGTHLLWHIRYGMLGDIGIFFRLLKLPFHPLPQPGHGRSDLAADGDERGQRIKRALDRQKPLRNPALERYEDAALVPDGSADVPNPDGRTAGRTVLRARGQRRTDTYAEVD